MKGELTLEILEGAIKQLPPMPRIKRIRISYGDYRKLREACNIFKICPEQPKGFTYGFMGERIEPDVDVKDNHYEIDWDNGKTIHGIRV